MAGTGTTGLTRPPPAQSFDLVTSALQWPGSAGRQSRGAVSVTIRRAERDGYVEERERIAELVDTARDLWRTLPEAKDEAEARGLSGDALVADVLHDLSDLPPEVEAVLHALDRE